MTKSSVTMWRADVVGAPSFNTMWAAMEWCRMNGIDPFQVCQVTK